MQRAADIAGVHRLTWRAWEKGTSVPEDYNYAGIERAMGWQDGSVRAVLDGGVPLLVADQAPVDPSEAAVRAAFELKKAELRDDAAARAWLDETVRKIVEKKSHNRSVNRAESA